MTKENNLLDQILGAIDCYKGKTFGKPIRIMTSYKIYYMLEEMCKESSLLRPFPRLFNTSVDTLDNKLFELFGIKVAREKYLGDGTICIEFSSGNFGMASIKLDDETDDGFKTILAVMYRHWFINKILGTIYYVDSCSSSPLNTQRYFDDERYGKVTATYHSSEPMKEINL